MRNLQQRLNKNARIYAALGAALVMVCGLLSAHAQRRFGGFGGRGARDDDGIPYERMAEQQQMKKAIDPAFKEDVFTFARLRFENEYRGRAWYDDSPNADLMLIYRLFEATSLKVRPGLNYIDITTKDLADYPFVYMAGAGQVSLSEEEAKAMRLYLLNGGFMMVDDFWGDEAWEHFAHQLKLIFPDRAPELLDLTHPIFHNVYSFKKQPQIPSGNGYGYNRNDRTYTSYDTGYDYNRMTHDPHYFGIYDDKRRLVMLVCHNNHYGDGWEHEGDDVMYFDLFSMPMGYPMFINIMTYAMTH
jgi:hypothetical protein